MRAVYSRPRPRKRRGGTDAITDALDSAENAAKQGGRGGAATLVVLKLDVRTSKVAGSTCRRIDRVSTLFS